MSNLYLDPELRIGRFLLCDIIRSFGPSQWFLSNITSHSQMTEPLLAEIMGCLMHVEAGELSVSPHRGSVAYLTWKKPLLHSSYFRPRLTRGEADSLIEFTCAEAKALNADSTHPFIYRKLSLFGSCLRNRPDPGDVDLAAEIYCRDTDQEVPEPSGYPFGGPETFHTASRFLMGRGNRHKVSIHHRRELEKLAAPHRLIWTLAKGRVDAPVVTPRKSAQSAEAEFRARSQWQERQRKLDRFAARVRAVRDWPIPPVLDLMGVRDISRAKWLELQKNNLVLSVAHLYCFPRGCHRDQLEAELRQIKIPRSEVLFAERWAWPYIKAGAKYNPWSLRANGRLLRKRS